MTSTARVVGFDRVSPSLVHKYSRLRDVSHSIVVLEQIKATTERTEEHDSLTQIIQRLSAEKEQLRLTLARP